MPPTCVSHLVWKYKSKQWDKDFPNCPLHLKRIQTWADEPFDNSTNNKRASWESRKSVPGHTRPCNHAYSLLWHAWREKKGRQSSLTIPVQLVSNIPTCVEDCMFSMRKLRYPVRPVCLDGCWRVLHLHVLVAHQGPSSETSRVQLESPLEVQRCLLVLGA